MPWFQKIGVSAPLFQSVEHVVGTNLVRSQVNFLPKKYYCMKALSRLLEIRALEKHGITVWADLLEYRILTRRSCSSEDGSCGPT